MSCSLCLRYGKFEAGNKLSYDQFEEALVRDGIVPPDQDFVRSTLLPKMQASHLRFDLVGVC